MTRRSLLGLLPFVPVTLAAVSRAPVPPLRCIDLPLPDRAAAERIAAARRQLAEIADGRASLFVSRCDGKSALAADLAELIAGYRRMGLALPAELRAFADSMR